MRSTSPDFDIHIRLARLTDVAALTHHRVSMFRDMSELPPHLEPELAQASEAFFHASVASGGYVAWLAVTNDAPERVVAGAGLWLRPMLPRPTPTSISQGREGLVANVYTEPEWRRHGVATLLMRQLLDYVREHRIERVRLHASDHGRRLYESLGFAASNENEARPSLLRQKKSAPTLDGAPRSEQNSSAIARVPRGCERGGDSCGAAHDPRRRTGK